MIGRGAAWTALATLVVLGAPVPAGDPAAAAEQYRNARRLAAERAPDAEAAFERVVVLDPTGPLADDARIEQAVVLGVARWPEELGRLGSAAAARAASLLDRAAGLDPPGDRTDEARYLRALLRLEPTTGFDLSAAREALAALASGSSAWVSAAILARGWLAEQEGDLERAEAAYQRLLIDAPSTEAAGRAEGGLGRVQLARGAGAKAARALQRSIDRLGDGDAGARALRELAVRAALGGPEPGASPLDAPKPLPGVRSPVLLEALPGGGVVAGDRKAGVVLELGADGREIERSLVPDLAALAVAPQGTVYVAAGGEVLRRLPGGVLERHSGVAEYAPVSAIAADGLGRVVVVDRRGQRAGLLLPGSAAPDPVALPEAVRLADVGWARGRWFGLDVRGRAVWTWSAGSPPARFELPSADRPVALAVDALGRATVLDSRVRALWLLDAAGAPRGAVGLAGTGIERAVALATGTDGSLHLLDEATNAWWRVP